MYNLNLIGGRVALNVLAKDGPNARDVQEAAQGSALIGVTAKDFASVDEAVERINEMSALAGKMSIGLGAGDSSQWEKVISIAERVAPAHINQVFPVAGYTRAYLKARGLNPVVNALVAPTGKPGVVRISTGPLSEAQPPAEVLVDTALSMLKECGISSVKFFPLEGERRLEELRSVAEAAVRVGIDIVEPTGGINEGNFEQILKVCLQSGVKIVIPHVYTAIVDKATGLTKPAAVANLLAITKRNL